MCSVGRTVVGAECERVRSAQAVEWRSGLPFDHLMLLDAAVQVTSVGLELMQALVECALDLP